MPLVTITAPKGNDPARKRTLLDGVHAALVAAFGIPADDRFQILNEVEPGNWVVGRGAYEVLVEIKAFAGRSVEAKRALYRAVVENLSRAGYAPEAVFIIVGDAPLENWGIRGGRAACDIDFGFRIDV